MWRGENLEIDYQNAQGDATNLATICQGMDDGSYDLVVTIATPATQAFVGLESDTPCVFCSVAAPVEAGVMSSLDTPDMNATGTSNAVPSGDVLELGRMITPGISNVGLFYCTSEVNAVNAMETAREYLDENSIAYEEATVASSADVQTSAQSLLDKGVDCIFIANDSVVQSAVDLLVELCNAAGVPTYCCSATTVQSGCLATLAMSDVAHRRADRRHCRPGALRYPGGGYPRRRRPGRVRVRERGHHERPRPDHTRRGRGGLRRCAVPDQRLSAGLKL